MKHKGKLIGLLALICIPLAFFFLQPNNPAQVAGATSVETELEEEKTVDQEQHTNPTIQKILEYIQTSPDPASEIAIYTDQPENHFWILYDNGIFGGTAESKEEFFKRALEFDNGQGEDLNLEDVASISEVKEAIETMQQSE